MKGTWTASACGIVLKLYIRVLPNWIPLRLYRDNIWLLNLKAGGLLVEYIVRFQGLTILWQKTDKTVKSEDWLVTKMVKQIEYLLLSRRRKNIKRWITAKR